MGGSIYLFQAGITPGNSFIAPMLHRPEFAGFKYVKLTCNKEDEVMVLGNGRAISRFYIERKHIIYLELEKEAVVTVERPGGSTAIFECSDTNFKVD